MTTRRQDIMEQREIEEMHEGLDQALRVALQGLGSLRERKARSDQVKADQTRVAAAADRRQFESYQQAQDAMLRGQLGNVTDDKWWDTSSSADIAATVNLAERYADVSPYAHATLTNLHSEAERRGVDLNAGCGPGEQELGEDGPILSPTADPSNDIGEDGATVERDGADRPAGPAGPHERVRGPHKRPRAQRPDQHGRSTDRRTPSGGRASSGTRRR